MPMGKYPDQVGAFQKWATDQVKRGSVAGNKVTSSRGRKWRLKRRKGRKKRGLQD